MSIFETRGEKPPTACQLAAWNNNMHYAAAPALIYFFRICLVSVNAPYLP